MTELVLLVGVVPCGNFGLNEKAVVESSIFFQFTSVLAAVRVVSFAGDPAAVPLLSSNSKVAAW